MKYWKLTVLAMTAITASSPAQNAGNHNPAFSVPDTFIGGEPYIFIGEDDGEVFEPRTPVGLQLRNPPGQNEPYNGSTTLQWSSSSSGVLAFDEERSMTGFKDEDRTGDGDTGEAGDPWTWTNDNQANFHNDTIFLQGSASAQPVTVTLESFHSKDPNDKFTKDFTLLKVDIDIHRPNVPFVGLSRPAPIEIPENEQQNPNRCQILINDDNDDLDSLFNGSAIADPYPQDNDDDILKIRDPIGFGHPTDDDDVVLVTLRQFNGVNTGKIKLTTSSNADVRFFKYEEGEYELDAVSFSDLEVDLSNPGTESPLKDLLNEDVSFYVEGINANDDLAVQMIFEDTSGNELARQEVHLKIIGTKPLSLSAQGHGGLGESMAQSNLTEMIQGANIVRRDRDGLDADADVSVPVTFKLGQWKGMDNDPTHADWYTTTSSQYGESKDILDYMESVPGGLNIYLIYDVTNAGGFARRGAEVMVIPIQGSPHDVVAHEWLHAFGNIGHICTTDHLMVGDGCDSSIQRGSDVTESEKTLFLAED